VHEVGRNALEALSVQLHQRKHVFVEVLAACQHSLFVKRLPLLVIYIPEVLKMLVVGQILQVQGLHHRITCLDSPSRLVQHAAVVVIHVGQSGKGGL